MDRTPGKPGVLLYLLALVDPDQDWSWLMTPVMESVLGDLGSPLGSSRKGRGADPNPSAHKIDGIPHLFFSGFDIDHRGLDAAMPHELLDRR